MLLIIEQVLNGLQFGIMLFLMSAGLTLVFGIMKVINLAHGSFYMIGAYVGATVTAYSGSFLLGVLAALLIAALVGMVVECVVLRRLYNKDHVDQVLATFGLIMFFNEMIRIVWGGNLCSWMFQNGSREQLKLFLASHILATELQ